MPGIVFSCDGHYSVALSVFTRDQGLLCASPIKLQTIPKLNSELSSIYASGIYWPQAGLSTITQDLFLRQMSLKDRNFSRYYVCGVMSIPR